MSLKPRDSALRELGDFIAHREERTKGPFHAYLELSHREFGQEAPVESPPVTDEDFRSGLLSENNVFALAQLQQELEHLCQEAGAEQLPPERLEVVVLMVISILQGAVFEGICRVIVGLTHKDIGLVAVFWEQHRWGPRPRFSGSESVVQCPHR